ncbi:ribosome small subunit-dependent GTPase, partial [Candidatus Margulisiibacteriota bacterium]
TLFLLKGNKCLIDTPGMRELQPWEADASLEGSFPEIYVLAQNCRFKDCSHLVEKECAVQEAIKKRGLSEERFNGYLKLRKELDFLETKVDKKKFLEAKEKTKKFYRLIRQTKNRRKDWK